MLTLKERVLTSLRKTMGLNEGGARDSLCLSCHYGQAYNHVNWLAILQDILEDENVDLARFTKQINGLFGMHRGRLRQVPLCISVNDVAATLDRYEQAS